MRNFSSFLLTGSLMLLTAAVSLRCTAATVYVSYFALSPDPVTIKTGDVVYWAEGDPDFGPYAITGGWGTLFTPGGIQFNVPPGTYSYSAESAFGGGSWGGTVYVVADSPPVVTITSPTNGLVFAAPASFPFEADASDPDPNDLSDVEFWVGDTMVDDVFSPPYATTVTNLAAGTYTLKAIAWDYSSVTSTNSIVVTVINPGPITLKSPAFAGPNFVFQADGLTVGKTNVLLSSTNMMDWFPMQTNVPDGTSLIFTNTSTASRQFFRIMQTE